MKAAAIITAGIAVVLVGAALALSLRSSEDEIDTESFDAGEFAIQVPTEWEQLDEVPFPVADARNFDLSGAARGIDLENWIVAYSVPRPGSTPITESNVLALAPSLRDGFERLARAVPGGRLIRKPSAIEASGLPGLRLTFGYEGPEGDANTYELIQLVDALRVYSVGCNSTSEHAVVVGEACRQAASTLVTDEEDLG